MDLPGKARTALTDDTVNFAPDADNATNENDATCTGTFAAPTAPAGKVCLYLKLASPFALVYGAESYPDDVWSKSGFDVFLQTNTDNADVHLFASWAYTS